MTTKIKLKDNAFKLVKGIDEGKLLNDLKNGLGVKNKQTILRRSKYSLFEQLAVEEVFKRYGVEDNIWQH